MEHRRWRRLSSIRVIDSPYFQLRKDSVELPNGHRIDDYYVREGPSFSAIFALTPERRVVLVRQYKYGADRIVLELPAGNVEQITVE